MMKLLLIAAAAFVAVSADPIHYDKITEEINKAVDEAVAAIEKSETFDPMKVPDHSDKFERHIGIIDLKGELDMRNIQVRGLKQMKRVGDANVKSEDGVVKAHLLVGVHDDVVSMEYDLAYKLGDLHPNTHVISDIQDFVVELSLEVSEEGNMTLTSFEVRQFANVVNHIGGLSILDPIFAVLSDVLTAIFQDTVRAEMTKVLAPAFKKELERNNQ
uniref:Mite allergen Der p 7 n=1 Tax=Dermatophagoides pteronyssinus TaxID=6956 RepID=ALL7_DERPT|nr:RecName: Full=Mite allergen Der p 7; AltName: Full=Allergen Der p VII; AltName: Allergen=Der p 7; Flags: Precursor [Dermatophagoides pteronyssinus]AAA80264.1 Der p 7 allergen polypeptide [Dermatophagoides pteronyssinus]